jgi:hypothetical protein
MKILLRVFDAHRIDHGLDTQESVVKFELDLCCIAILNPKVVIENTIDKANKRSHRINIQ